MKRYAFTLAEILITLGIIGVVAAIIIPQFVSAYQSYIFPIRLKETYTKLQIAHEHVLQEYGLETGNDDKNIETFNHYADALSAGERCMRYTYKGCGLASDYKMLNGENAMHVPNWSGYGLFESGYNWRFKMNNGAHIAIFFISFGSNGASVLWNLNSQKCRIAFLIDVNGAQKPNTLGRDIFAFKIPNNKTDFIVPYLEDVSDCNKNGAGLSCAQKIMNESWKMNY